MIEGAMGKPIDEIRYPNVAKQARRLMMLATVEFVVLIVVLVAVEKLMPLDAGPHHAILASDGSRVKFTSAPRIGIAYASKSDQNRKWRFTCKTIARPAAASERSR